MIGVDTASTQLLGGIARFRPVAAILVRRRPGFPR